LHRRINPFISLRVAKKALTLLLTALLAWPTFPARLLAAERSNETVNDWVILISADGENYFARRSVYEPAQQSARTGGAEIRTERIDVYTFAAANNPREETPRKLTATLSDFELKVIWVPGPGITHALCTRGKPCDGTEAGGTDIPARRCRTEESTINSCNGFIRIHIDNPLDEIIEVQLDGNALYSRDEAETSGAAVPLETAEVYGELNASATPSESFVGLQILQVEKMAELTAITRVEDASTRRTMLTDLIQATPDIHTRSVAAIRGHLLGNEDAPDAAAVAAYLGAGKSKNDLLKDYCPRVYSALPADQSNTALNQLKAHAAQAQLTLQAADDESARAGLEALYLPASGRDGLLAACQAYGRSLAQADYRSAATEEERRRAALLADTGAVPGASLDQEGGGDDDESNSMQRLKTAAVAAGLGAVGFGFLGFALAGPFGFAVGAALGAAAFGVGTYIANPDAQGSAE
jgi:hypothetical protein